MVTRDPSNIEPGNKATADELGHSQLSDPMLGALGRGLAYFARVSEHEHRLALERERRRS